MTRNIDDQTKVSLSLRDWVGIIAAIFAICAVGGGMYIAMDRRVGALEKDIQYIREGVSELRSQIGHAPR